jgi:hypothetical protein
MQIGDVVVYVPRHTSDIFSTDCEVGVISSFNGSGNAAFVRYYRSSVLQSTSQATALVDLKPFPFEITDQCHMVLSMDRVLVVAEIFGEYVNLRAIETADDTYTFNYRDLRPTRSNKIRNFIQNEA